MYRWFLAAVAALLLLAGVTMGVLAIGASRQAQSFTFGTSAAVPDVSPAGGKQGGESQWLTRYTLTERSGRKFDSRELAGKDHVVNFFFTACPTVCRMQTAAVRYVAAGSLAAMLLALVGHRVFAPAYSVSGLAEAALQADSGRAKFYAVETYDHSMPWSLRRTVTMVGYKDELAVPISWEAKRFIPDLDSFGRTWNAEPEAYAFFAVRDFERLR